MGFKNIKDGFLKLRMFCKKYIKIIGFISCLLILLSLLDAISEFKSGNIFEGIYRVVMSITFGIVISMYLVSEKRDK